MQDLLTLWGQEVVSDEKVIAASITVSIVVKTDVSGAGLIDLVDKKLKMQNRIPTW